jgi:predicted DNA repair protein MutK
MAGSSFFALFDDIASILDDVSVMTKVAAKKTAGVLGDDLALNAQQVTGVPVNRELAVVWAVAKGSFVNKLILVPAALLVSAFAPWAITPLLMLGGAFLCYEGVEKLAHKYLSHGDSPEGHHAALAEALQDRAVDMVAFERSKIKGAVRTDFILSAEIIVISLGAVAGADFTRQIMVLSIIAVAMTVGVYGLVAGIVKLDDLGLYLSRKRSQALAWLGRRIVGAAPYLMKTLSVVGTAAMFMVGGAILTHGIAPVHALVERAAAAVGGGGVVQALASTLLNALFGIVAGAVVLGAVGLAKRLFRKG